MKKSKNPILKVITTIIFIILAVYLYLALTK
jgi:hypothetical protein